MLVIVLWLPCSTGASDIGNYPEMRLGRDDQSEGMSDDLRSDFVRITSEKMSDVCMIWHFPSIGSEYSRTILQILLISPDINARPGRSHFVGEERNLNR